MDTNVNWDSPIGLKFKVALARHQHNNPLPLYNPRISTLATTWLTDLSRTLMIRLTPTWPMFYAYYNGYRVEIINANEAAAGTFNVTIYGTNKEESVDDIFGISKLVTSTLGSSMADSDVQAIKSNKTNYKLGNDLTVNYYPIVSLSYGDTEARIEIVSTNYK